ncbi:MAG: transporter [Candidatus Eisenbacteria bacterium]|uniref:Transporter n=1 Tax=Eiseniibacteriota bacterium TaxID=2212470 RepID=A0A933SE34_UNCEI|nr:transporter [Candidatus Eisenbacteria bacterium]
MSAVPRLRFDRHELAGAFGDIGTDLPLIVGLIAFCGLDPASVCIVFGLLQMATGVVYGIPMPVQPLKAMAAIMLAQKFSPGTLAAGGIVIGVVMLALALTRSLDWLARVVPPSVVRGIQLGLGLVLAKLALGEYAGADGARGYVLVAVAIVALLALRRQSRVPGPLVVIALGAAYALWHGLSAPAGGALVGLSLPRWGVPTQDEFAKGALLLALPQLALSLGNSVLATAQATRDLFPERAVGVGRIGFTYGLMNVVAPFFGGIPVCHGCGGLAGFHAFGARTGGAPVLYGALFVLIGLVFAPGFATVVRLFPMPILGTVLLMESVSLMGLVADVAGDRRQLWIALLVAAAVIGLPNGYVVGLVGGTIVAHAIRRGWLGVPVH